MRDLRPAFATEVAELGGNLHFLQSVLGRSSVAVTEKHYAKFAPKSAAQVTLRLIERGAAQREGGRSRKGRPYELAWFLHGHSFGHNKPKIGHCEVVQKPLYCCGCSECARSSVG